MREEYEIIPHEENNYHIFLVHLLYRNPHIHKDYELCMVLEGNVSFISSGMEQTLSEGDIYLTNPFQSHELRCVSPALILSLQVPTGFFQICPQMKCTEFLKAVLPCSETDPCRQIRSLFLEASLAHFRHGPGYSLHCISLIYELFYWLLAALPNREVSEKEQKNTFSRGLHMREIADYIDAHYAEKLLLTDIAGKQGLSLYYVSHFSKKPSACRFRNT
ncbi:MAG: cupin domain-containing protein [Chordicoccus sp.]